MELIGENPRGPAADAGIGIIERCLDDVDAQPVVSEPSQAPRRPRARRSWTDRRAAWPEARPTRPDPFGPARPRPPRAPAARDARAAGRSPGRIERRSGSGTSQRFSRSSSVFTSESVRGSRAGPAVAVSPAVQRRPRPGKRLGQGHHGVAGFPHGRAEVLMRCRLEPAAEILLLGQQVIAAPSRAPGGRAARRFEAASRRAARSCRPHSGRARNPSSCQPPSAFCRVIKPAGLALDLARRRPSCREATRHRAGESDPEAFRSAGRPPARPGWSKSRRRPRRSRRGPSGAASSRRTRQSRQAMPNLLSSGTTPFCSSAGSSRRDSHARARNGPNRSTVLVCLPLT